MDDRKSKSIDEFISGFPPEVQETLEELRREIRKVAPEAAETISYGILTFKLNGRNLVHFSAYKNHIGFYPTSSPMDVFKKDLSVYEVSKGTVRFPLDKPIPFALVKKIVAFRVREVSGTDKP